MLPHLSLLARSSVVVLTALATLPAGATAPPLGPVGPTTLANESGVTPVRWGGGYRGGGWGHRGVWRRGGWGGHYGGGWGRHYGGWGHRGWGGWGSGFGLGFGLGLPLGYYGGGYYGGGYYGSPYYGRRYYRRPYYGNYDGGGSSHVDWCYSRYRSYRAWDDTWQPYYGPRRQCISPY